MKPVHLALALLAALVFPPLLLGVGQEPAHGSQVGRYQLHSNAAGHTFRIDTLTGDVWSLELAVVGDETRLALVPVPDAPLVATGEARTAEQTDDPHLAWGLPAIDGAVLRVAPDSGLIVIDKGSDDGVRPGFTFDVYRGSQYKGHVRVESVQESVSTGVILRTYSGRAIEAGDRASTRL